MGSVELFKLCSLLQYISSIYSFVDYNKVIPKLEHTNKYIIILLDHFYL